MYISLPIIFLDLDTSADGDKMDPCLTRAEYINHDIWDTEK